MTTLAATIAVLIGFPIIAAAALAHTTPTVLAPDASVLCLTVHVTDMAEAIAATGLHVIADHRDSDRPWVAGTRCRTWTAIHHTDHTEGPLS